MSPITHFLASWTLAESCTENRRERLWVCLAGLAPELDGLGVAVDLANQFLGREETHYFFIYHHFLLHGLFGALLVVVIARLAGVLRLRTLLLVFTSLHLHLLCDFVGARGPTRDDLWVIHYFGPFTRKGTIWWTHQWPLNGWQNMLIKILLLAWITARSIRRGSSPVSLFSSRLDQKVISTLRQRWLQLSLYGQRVLSFRRLQSDLQSDA
jgi:hypothetical protein